MSNFLVSSFPSRERCLLSSMLPLVYELHSEQVSTASEGYHHATGIPSSELMYRIIDLQTILG